MGTKTGVGVGGTTHHLRHRWGDETPVSETIVDGVASCAGVDREELPPLGVSIDPDALDALFATTPDDEPRPGCVTFSYYGYTVVVQSTGRILLRRD